LTELGRFIIELEISRLIVH